MRLRIEKNINKVFTKALKELNMNQDKNYQKSLNSFLIEGIVLLDDSTLYASCNKKDRQLIQKIIPNLSKQYNKEIKLNDKSIDTPHKEIAREMIILTRQINKHLHSLQKDKEEENVTITCWTCHKGKTEVEPKRPVEE